MTRPTDENDNRYWTGRDEARSRLDTGVAVMELYADYVDVPVLRGERREFIESKTAEDALDWATAQGLIQPSYRKFLDSLTYDLTRTLHIRLRNQ